jgi:hypothetical protein
MALEGLLETSALESSVETGLNRVMSSLSPLDNTPPQDASASAHAAYQRRVEREASACTAQWPGKGLGLLADGSVPRGGAAVRHALLELAKGIARGGLAGLSLKGALSLVLSALGGAKGGAGAALRAAAGPDTRQFALFLGALVGLFRGLNAVSTAWEGRDAPVSAARAGAVAGVALLLDEASRRQMIALYLFSRGLDVATKRLVRDGRIPYWKHFEALLFGVSNMPIMYGFLFMPEILQPSYYKWILRMGVVTDKGLAGTLRERRDTFFKTGELIPFRPCSHGYHTGPCTVHCATDWVAGLLRAGKIYLPVHLVPLLLLRTKALAKDPAPVLSRTALGFASSCAFLSTYVLCVKGSQCFLRNLRQEDAGWHALVAGLLTGLSTYLEQPARISELMLYCLPRGLEATWIYLERAGYVVSIKNFEAVFMSCAMAVLLSSSKADFKRAYYDSLCFLLGSDASSSSGGGGGGSNGSSSDGAIDDCRR